MNDHFEDKFADKLGIRLDLSKKNDIVNAVNQVLKFKAEDIKSINLELISNFKHSATEIVNYLESHAATKFD